MGLALLLGIFALCVVIGVPVAFAMGISALIVFFYEGFPLLITFQRIISGTTIFSLLAIPFFIFAGELMLHGGIAQRLVRFASTLVGHLRGGLARRQGGPVCQRRGRPDGDGGGERAAEAAARTATCPEHRVQRNAGDDQLCVLH